MDNAIWIAALISVVGTLVGVFLGSWLQARSSKQQRQWMLRDQKHEWVRRHRQEDSRIILSFMNHTLELALSDEVLDTLSNEKLAELVLEHKKKVTSAMPLIYMLIQEGNELGRLLVEFEQRRNETFDAMQARDNSKLDTTSRRISEISGLVKEHIDKWLEKTFDKD